MAPRRKIIFSRRCDESVARLGGYQEVDRVLDGILDALSRNPRGFGILETDYFSCRYATTKPVGRLPRLVCLFRIQPDGSVVIEDIETLDEY